VCVCWCVCVHCGGGGRPLCAEHGDLVAVGKEREGMEIG
jgi:hypothetical protein